MHICESSALLSSCLCVHVCNLSLTTLVYLPLVNKEEVVQKARPVSSDVGSANPNFSDLMDEFIQERLRAKGTAVSTTRTNAHRCHVSQTTKKKIAESLKNCLFRVVAAAAQEVWRFPGICRSSWRQRRFPDPAPQMTSVRSMTRGFPLNGRLPRVPAALTSSAQTANQTPLMPSSIQPASLTVRKHEKKLRHCYRICDTSLH